MTPNRRVTWQATSDDENSWPRCAAVAWPRGPARAVRPINGGKSMIGRHIGIALAALGSMAIAAPALAQNEQFIPALVYRTGAYAPNGVPIANGIADYY